MKRFTIIMVLLFGLAATAAQGQSDSQRVGPGDVLQIQVYAAGDKQEDFTATVSALETIVCPLLGTVRLEVAETPAIAAQLRTLLAGDYFVDPQVLVGVKEVGGRVYVMGEVKRPGVYPINDARTALNACVIAGGFTDFASVRRAQLTRNQDGQAKAIWIDLVKVRQGRSPDVVLRSGDRLEIPHRWF